MEEEALTKEQVRAFEQPARNAPHDPLLHHYSALIDAYVPLIFSHVKLCSAATSRSRRILSALRSREPFSFIPVLIVRWDLVQVTRVPEHLVRIPRLSYCIEHACPVLPLLPLSHSCSGPLSHGRAISCVAMPCLCLRRLHGCLFRCWRPAALPCRTVWIKPALHLNILRSAVRREPPVHCPEVP